MLLHCPAFSSERVHFLGDVLCKQLIMTQQEKEYDFFIITLNIVTVRRSLLYLKMKQVRVQNEMKSKSIRSIEL